MRIFLTGSTGYLGSHLVRTLLDAGHELTILSRRPPKIASLDGHQAIQFVVANLEHSVDLKMILAGHDALIHNAIIWDEEPTELEMKDVRAAAKLFEAAASSGVGHIILTSSVAVHRPFRVRMDETSPLQPADYYGATKAANESFLWAVANQYGVRANVLRLGPLVGAPAYPDAPFKSDRRFKEFAETARNNGVIKVDDGDGRQFLGVSDAASIFRSVLDSGLDREVLLCASQDTVTWEHVAMEIVRGIGSSSQIVKDASVLTQKAEFDVTKLFRSLRLKFNSTDAVAEHIRCIIQRLQNTS